MGTGRPVHQEIDLFALTFLPGYGRPKSTILGTRKNIDTGLPDGKDQAPFQSEKVRG